MTRGVTSHWTSLKRAAGIVGTYRRYNKTTQELEIEIEDVYAVPDATSYLQQVQGAAVSVRKYLRPLLFWVEDLIDGTTPVYPRDNDTFTEAVSGLVWRVNTPPTSETPVDYLDSTQLIFRVNTTAKV